jgi:hypothetical protein
MVCFSFLLNGACIQVVFLAHYSVCLPVISLPQVALTRQLGVTCVHTQFSALTCVGTRICRIYTHGLFVGDVH